MTAVLWSMIITGIANPYRYPGFRRIEYLNDATKLAWCHLMVTFTDFVGDIYARIKMGSVLILLVSSNILVNFVYANNSLIFFAYYQARLSYVKFIYHTTMKHRQERLLRRQKEKEELNKIVEEFLELQKQ